MHYSVELFDVEGEQLARRMREDRDELLLAVRERITAEAKWMLEEPADAAEDARGEKGHGVNAPPKATRADLLATAERLRQMARRTQADRDELLAAVRERIASMPEEPVNAVEDAPEVIGSGLSPTPEMTKADWCIALGEKICRRVMPINCSEDYFIALWWIANVGGERIELESIRDIRSIELIEELGVIQLFKPSRAPFPVPVSDMQCPAVVYIDHRQVAGVSCDEIEQRMAFAVANSKGPGKRPDPGEVVRIRIEISEIVESIAAEEHDLLMIVTH